MNGFFQNKVVIITGASSGIGEASARLLDEQGAKLVLAARRKDNLDLLSKKFKNAFPIQTDVRAESSVKNMVEQTMQKFGRIDLLINNAGVLLYKPMPETTSDEIRDVMETNFFGAVLCARAVLPVMIKQKSGAIANIASIAGRIGFPNLGYYCASKFALVGFSETLRQEVEHKGIFVTTVCPGTVYTPMTQKIVEEAAQRGKKLRPVSAETAALKILRAVEKKKIEVFIPFPVRIIYFLHFFFPKFTEWLAYRFRAAEPPDGQPAK